MLDRLFDIVICMLLITTILHLALVQRRLRAFRAERDRLQAFVTALDLTVERAETAIRRLRNVEGEAKRATPDQPRTVRTRSPDDLLRAARIAAGVDGKRKADDAPAGRGATSIAQKLHQTLGG